MTDNPAKKSEKGQRLDLQQKAQAIYAALLASYGKPAWHTGAGPLDVLINTILSANTSDVNSGRAFVQLKNAFGNDWDTIRRAPLAEIKKAIRPAGMYNQKAPAIVATLEKLKQERGDYDLRYLATLSVEQALAYLTSFPGVGHKTASIVLLFCFNLGSFPVDTHIQRISQRLGICGHNASTAQIKTIWEHLLPTESYYPLHMNLIAHGRQICRARSPSCERCPLVVWCDYYNHQGAWAADGARSTR
jgi:endonuclease-3